MNSKGKSVKKYREELQELIRAMHTFCIYRLDSHELRAACAASVAQNRALRFKMGDDCVDFWLDALREKQGEETSQKYTKWHSMVSDMILGIIKCTTEDINRLCCLFGATGNPAYMDALRQIIGQRGWRPSKDSLPGAMTCPASQTVIDHAKEQYEAMKQFFREEIDRQCKAGSAPEVTKTATNQFMRQLADARLKYQDVSFDTFENYSAENAVENEFVVPTQRVGVHTDDINDILDAYLADEESK
jgi:hypothetical protein